MTDRTRPPFRADHVGSLLRPPEIVAARQQRANGEISAEQLRAVEDDAIRAAVRKQEEIGLRSATDGEFRRTTWHMDFIHQLGGIGTTAGTRSVRFQNAGGDTIEWTPDALRVTERIHLDHTIFGADHTTLRGMVTTAEPKQTIPSPSMVFYRGGRSAIDETIYPELDDFHTDLAAAYAAELRGMYDLGCRYLQLDDTSLAYLNDPKQRAMLAELGGDPETQHLVNIRQINAAIRDRPDDLAVTVHLCRGNYRSSWVAEGGYDYVAEALFTELDVDGFFLEFDDERSGGFEPLRFLPPGKQVVLGLMTTKTGVLESKDDLKHRIDQAAKFVPLDQLCISPQCGFSSTVDGNEITVDQQWAKLALLVEVAEEVWT
ncbi:5-methyltetrahydropteroyltriglutamate--homocysteine S-methyltransferase [Saccharopolyspora sp. K220]|uniref:5-methyltetrahydropteroyltriglutamate-- homocysteine S-methyltransferase n=1 Tax=Saccharopolyspora soli TaxID=2926618 RepID=UPI001F5A6C00|nr:5-methyltetrahydropteroyltriglutamate--homocysteine S-methyltransferase [Saccharopolyspora soli]MCI2415863.1 5-methyltetrahydropteroyltriglutamate--homocysteine S-methyltransferase [Saccharopolyspora soli]